MAPLPRPPARTAAVRTTIGVAKTMGVGIRGQIIAVMVMQQESSIRNLANDGTSGQSASWPWPGRGYWLAVTKLSLRYPHDRFGMFDGAHDTDSVGPVPAATRLRLGRLRGQQRADRPGRRGPPATGPAVGGDGVLRWRPQRGADLGPAGHPRLGRHVEEPGRTGGAAEQQSRPYGQWETLATNYVNGNQDAPPVDLPWYPGGGQDLTGCFEPLVISLNARADGRFVVAENGGASPLIANRTAIGPWEQYDFLRWAAPGSPCGRTPTTPSSAPRTPAQPA